MRPRTCVTASSIMSIALSVTSATRRLRRASRSARSSRVFSVDRLRHSACWPTQPSSRAIRVTAEMLETLFRRQSSRTEMGGSARMNSSFSAL